MQIFENKPQMFKAMLHTIFDLTSSFLVTTFHMKRKWHLSFYQWSNLRNVVEEVEKKGEKKYIRGWVGFWKSYVIFRVGHDKCLRLLTMWVGGVEKGQKHAYVIFEWSLMQFGFCRKSMKVNPGFGSQYQSRTLLKTQEIITKYLKQFDMTFWIFY